MPVHPVFEFPTTLRSYLIFAGLCFLLALLTFGSLYEHQFEIDDNDYLSDAEIALKTPSHLLSSDRYVACRPVVDLVFMVTHAIWGNNPAAYHLLLASLHFVSSMVLFWTFRIWRIDFELSAFATLLFLMHVGHFRAVHWISCLAYPLALIFCLLVLVTYRHFFETGNYRYFVVAMAFLNLAILAHASSSAVVLCILYFAYRQRVPVREIILQALPLGFIAVVLVWLLSLLSVNTPQAEHGLGQTDFPSFLYSWYWFTGRLYAFAFWLPQNMGGAQISDMIIGAIVALLGIWSIWRRRGAISDWIVWSLVLVLPFTTDHHPIAQEHWIFGPSRYLYLASAGSSLVLAWLIREVILKGIPSLKIKKWLFVSFTTTIVILCVVSLKRAEGITFYKSARFYITGSSIELGESLYNKAVSRDMRLLPLIATVAFSSGVSLKPWLEQAEKENPNDAQIAMLSGVSAFFENDPKIWRLGKQQISRAFEIAQNKPRMKQQTSQALMNLGSYFGNAGDYIRAVELYKEALLFRPNYPLGLMNLGNVYDLKDQQDLALQQYVKAIRLDKSQIPLLILLAKRRQQDEDLVGALQVFQEIMKVEPQNPEARAALDAFQQ